MSNVRTVVRLDGESKEGLDPVEVVCGYLIRKSRRQDRSEYMLIGRPIGRAGVIMVGHDSEGNEVTVRIECDAPTSRQVERAIVMKRKIEQLRELLLRKVVQRILPLASAVKRIDYVATEILSVPVSGKELETARRDVALAKGVRVTDVVPVPDLGPGW